MDNNNRNMDDGNQPKMPRNNMNWIYRIIIEALAILYETRGGHSLES